MVGTQERSSPLAAGNNSPVVPPPVQEFLTGETELRRSVEQAIAHTHRLVDDDVRRSNSPLVETFRIAQEEEEEERNEDTNNNGDVMQPPAREFLTGPGALRQSVLDAIAQVQQVESPSRVENHDHDDAPLEEEEDAPPEEAAPDFEVARDAIQRSVREARRSIQEAVDHMQAASRRMDEIMNRAVNDNDVRRQDDNDDDDDSMPPLLGRNNELFHVRAPNNNNGLELYDSDNDDTVPSVRPRFAAPARRGVRRPYESDSDEDSLDDDDSMPRLRPRYGPPPRLRRFSGLDDYDDSDDDAIPALRPRRTALDDSSSEEDDDDSMPGLVAPPSGRFARWQLGFTEFPQVQELSDDLVTHILSFVSEIPFEKPVARHNPTQIKSTLSDDLPVVCKRFHRLCVDSATYYWRIGLERLVTREPSLWRKGLLSIMGNHEEEDTDDEEEESAAELVERAFATVNAESYKALFQQVHRDYLCSTKPVFTMPGFVRLGRQFGIHFFEPRYRRMIADVLELFPESARIGDDILPNENGDVPTFIYATSTPLRVGSTACVVQVQHCIVHEDGTADASLIPLYHVRLQSVDEIPDSGRLHVASCIRLGSAESQRLNRATPFGDLGLDGAEINVGRAIDHFLQYLAAGIPGHGRFAFRDPDDDEDEDDDDSVDGEEDEDDGSEDDEGVLRGFFGVRRGAGRIVARAAILNRGNDDDEESDDDDETDDDMPPLIGREEMEEELPPLVRSRSDVRDPGDMPNDQQGRRADELGQPEGDDDDSLGELRAAALYGVRRAGARDE